MNRKVLLACEKSQIVTSAMRDVGIEAYSCDIQDCTGEHPEWHYKTDVRELLNQEWGGAIIAFPPCTHLAVSGARFFKQKKQSGIQQEAVDFFKLFTENKNKRIAIENPVGIMSTEFRRPDQIINPYYFGDNIPKKTCLWLKNLPRLVWYDKNMLFECTCVNPEYVLYKSKKNKSGFSRYSIYGKLGGGDKKTAELRSVFFKGIAKAMAEQWGSVILS